MVEGYARQLKAILLEHGWTYLLSGKGDHEIWARPENAKAIVVDHKIMSRHTANAVAQTSRDQGEALSRLAEMHLLQQLPASPRA